MTDNPHWPYFPHELQHHKILAENAITILYYPLTGGEFLANVLSCCNEFNGERFFDVLEDYYTFKPGRWVYTYENNHHPKIFPAHARYYTFSEWLQVDKLIHINYNLSKQETDYLLFRKSFIKNTTCDYKFSDLQIKYELELINFLKLNNKQYFDFPLVSFFKEKTFIEKVNECVIYFNFSALDQIKLARLYQTYKKLNYEKFKNRK
jgi:hypothetical protein